MVASIAEIKHGHPGGNLGSAWGQPRVNLGSNRGQPGVNQHRPTCVSGSSNVRCTRSRSLFASVLATPR